ncbi:MAG: sigma-70 family RNA polymerase sigma factor [Thermomicrobiales bacterium]
MTATTARLKGAAQPALSLPNRFRLSRHERSPNATDASVATASLDAWFDHALPRVYGYFITRVGGNVHIAEDLTQETMLAAVVSRGLASADEPLAWLFGIARHKLLDHYRRQDRHRHRDAPDETALDTVPDDRALPDLDLERNQTRDAIVSALQELPTRQRAAIVLRYLDGLDVPTTAAMLGISIHAAESLLARGRRTFRQHFSAREGIA